MTEYVKVNIQGEERVRYDQTVRMKKNDFDRLSAMLESDDRSESKKAQEIIGDYLDRKDILDADDFDLDDFMIVEGNEE